MSVCSKCGKTIEESHAFCPYCGQRQKSGEAWYYQPIWILILALFVIGPFALILVWKSSKMGRGSKLVMAAVILVYTGYCVYLIYKVAVMEVQEFNEFNDLMRQLQ